MLKVDLVSDPGVPDAAAVGVIVWDDGGTLRVAAGGPAAAAGADLPSSVDSVWCRSQGFAATAGGTLVLRSPGSAAGAGWSPAVVLVGGGPSSPSGPTAAAEALRRAVAGFVRATGDAERALLVVPGDGAAGVLDREPAGAALAEGALLASYRFDAYRTGERRSGLGRLSLLSDHVGTAELAAGLARGERVAQSVALARDLVNEPASALTPTVLAGRAADLFAGRPGLSVEVWDEERIAAERLGGLLGVARGSAEPPRLVRVAYEPADPLSVGGRTPHVAFVGKGITFDSGGLSLKTAGGMETMKTDMGGAAAVLGALDAAAALGARVRLSAVTPLTENMPGGSATKPGDVLTTRSGQTIEVLNTDAEGRLVLSDALTLAVESEPDAVVDLATLTGAVVTALGREIGGLLGSDDALVAAVRTAGDRAGEPLWPLPLPDEYRSHIDSDVADMRNVGKPGQAGTIAAALLLRRFVGAVPWAHLDIAGTARSDEAVRYLSKGGTGVGVRTLVELACSVDLLGAALSPAGPGT
ncbi:MAG: leucyl aminopeptidase [Actinomycetota bacterium]|nr:leucyl aminopeptidase [Actinomycetota bacterium]